MGRGVSYSYSAILVLVLYSLLLVSNRSLGFRGGDEGEAKEKERARSPWPRWEEFANRRGPRTASRSRSSLDSPWRSTTRRRRALSPLLSLSFLWRYISRFVSKCLLEFGRVVKAKEQVVAGTLHHLTVEAIDAGKKKLYEAKVWVKPWLNFKELQEFRHAGDSPSFTAADLGAKRGGHESGWLKTIQQRSNSLTPYELLEILHAKAEVIEELAKFDMLLKLKRGNKEEKFKVEVHKKLEGTFDLNHVQQEH
uniref:Cysteine proteinase inhibitor n=1 Tax=Ananas comosus var. bracteatus TaxID=296719 RepID=A0A6V7PEF3_ANACO|nr:unnamed protein product [Ananas comosus var. bracteatus]